jgi:hypothetical protein
MIIVIYNKRFSERTKLCEFLEAHLKLQPILPIVFAVRTTLNFPVFNLDVFVRTIFCSSPKFEFVVVSDIFSFLMRGNIEKSEMIMIAYYDQIYQIWAWFSKIRIL